MNKKLMLQSLKRTGFVLFIFIAFIATAMFIISPLAMNALVQQVGYITVLDIIIVLTVIIAGHLVNAVSVFLRTKLTRNFFVKAVSKIYDNVFRITYDRYIDEGPSALQSRINESVSAYAGFYFDTVPSIITNSFVVAATVIIVFTINPFIAIAMLATLPLSYIGYKILNKRLSFLSIEMNKICSEAWANENALISQVDFIKQNSQNHLLLPFVERFKFDHQEITRKVNNTAMGWSMLMDGINKFINHVIILVLAFMMLNDITAVGGAIFIMLILPYFTSAVAGLRSVNLGMAGVVAANEFFDEITKNTAPSGQLTIDKIDQITFDIDKVAVKDKVLLKNVRLKAKKGDIIGIMGQSGYGKSTLVKLLMKFRPCSGIYVDKVPISDINTTGYLNLVSYYSQNTPIVTDTLYNNLNFGRVPVSRDVYRNLEFLTKFKNLDEKILENGANLSAGDRQRIALARVFTEDAQVIVLDEPTSSLDKETEVEILASILDACKDKIVFLISHNVENLKQCSQMYKIKSGRLEKVR